MGGIFVNPYLARLGLGGGPSSAPQLQPTAPAPQNWVQGRGYGSMALAGSPSDPAYVPPQQGQQSGGAPQDWIPGAQYGSLVRPGSPLDPASAATSTPVSSPSSPSVFKPWVRELPGAVGQTLRGYAAPLFNAGLSYAGIHDPGLMMDEPPPAPGVLPTVHADSAPPSSRTQTAAKQARSEPTAAAAPPVPFQAASKKPTEDPRNTGKKPGDRGYVYTNLDLDRVHETGPTRGGFIQGSESPEDRLFSQAMRTAEARGKAEEADPTGIRDYAAKAQIQGEFAGRTDRMILEQKNQIQSHFDTMLERARQDPKLDPGKREEILQRIKEARDQNLSAVDPRYKGTAY